MRKNSDDRLIEAVREVLIIADALGLFETSIHLNAALTTLDGKGMLPLDETRKRVLH